MSEQKLECPQCQKAFTKTAYNSRSCFNEKNTWSHDEIACPFCGTIIETEV